MSRLYALLVGINQYDNFRNLDGCVDDATRVRDMLAQRFPQADILMLTDAQATHQGIIDAFRSHLGQAKAGDIAYFHYSGHGARSRSAPEFAAYFPEGLDEGFICHDSRTPGGLDLADKELAVLLAELSGTVDAAPDTLTGSAPDGPHIVLSLDCCHSGSATRDGDSDPDVISRLGDPNPTPRRIEDYLGGFYARQIAAGGRLSIPLGRYVSLAACDRTQTAYESRSRKAGFFTTALLDVVNGAGGAISYQDLYVRARAAVRSAAWSGNQQQDPRFEAYGGFDAGQGFLGTDPGTTRPSHLVRQNGDNWVVECGALQGLPADPDTPASFAILPETGSDTPLTQLRTSTVGTQLSVLERSALLISGQRYRGVLTSLPVPPLVLGVADADIASKLSATLAQDPSVPVAIVPGAAPGGYQLAQTAAGLELTGRGRSILTLDPDTNWTAPLAEALGKIARWERLLALSNPRTRFAPDAVMLVPEILAPDGTEQQLTVPVAEILWPDRPDPSKIPLRFSAHNSTDKSYLNVALFYFSPQYGIRQIANTEELAPGKTTLLYNEDFRLTYSLPAGVQQSEDRFKLLICTDKVDSYLLVQSAINAPATRDADEPPLPTTLVTPDWTVVDFTFRLTRRPA